LTRFASFSCVFMATSGNELHRTAKARIVSHESPAMATPGRGRVRGPTYFLLSPKKILVYGGLTRPLIARQYYVGRPHCREGQ
jgi:hypothetical protein